MESGALRQFSVQLRKMSRPDRSGIWFPAGCIDPCTALCRPQGATAGETARHRSTCQARPDMGDL